MRSVCALKRITPERPTGLASYPDSRSIQPRSPTEAAESPAAPMGHCDRPDFVTFVALRRFPYQEHRRNVMSVREESMSNRGGHRGGHRQARTITLPWRKACATIPAVALISGGIALASPAEDLKSAAASKASPALVVPGTALAMPAVPTRTGTQGPPGLVLPAGTVPGGSTSPG